MNQEQNDPHPAPPGNARSRALRFYVAVAAVVLLSVGGYAIIRTNQNSGDRNAEQSATGGKDGSGTASSNDPSNPQSSSDPSSSRPGQTQSQSSPTQSATQGQASATTSTTRPPNPSDPLQIDNCGGPPYPKTFEGWTGAPDYTNAEKVVYYSGPPISLNQLGYEIARVANLGCVSVPLFGANQVDLSALAWSNDGLFTKAQVITAMSRIGLPSIATPACHPNCFK